MPDLVKRAYGSINVGRPLFPPTSKTYTVAFKIWAG